MKIRELFENFNNKDKDEEKQFDVADDLLFFMRNNDDFYRRHYYPKMLQYKNAVKRGGGLKPVDFKELVHHAYECYTSEFKDTMLPESIESDVLKEVCNKIHAEEKANIDNKVY